MMNRTQMLLFDSLRDFKKKKKASNKKLLLLFKSQPRTEICSSIVNFHHAFSLSRSKTSFFTSCNKHMHFKVLKVT